MSVLWGSLSGPSMSGSSRTACILAGRFIVCIAAAALLCLSTPVFAQDEEPADKQEEAPACPAEEKPADKPCYTASSHKAGKLPAPCPKTCPVPVTWKVDCKVVCEPLKTEKCENKEVPPLKPCKVPGRNDIASSYSTSTTGD